MTVVYAYTAEPSRVATHVRSQVLDVNAPTLTATVPATGTAGAALDMSAAATDLWGPVSVTWAFGDGATATGTSPSHTYAAAGTYDVRVTATDGSGNATSLTRTVTVAAVPPGAPVGDRTPPVLSRARLAPDLLPTGHGARLRLTSSEAGRLVGVVERRRPNGQWRDCRHQALVAGGGSQLEDVLRPGRAAAVGVREAPRAPGRDRRRRQRVEPGRAQVPRRPALRGNDRAP